jgi:hypothetical protein
MPQGKCQDNLIIINLCGSCLAPKFPVHPNFKKPGPVGYANSDNNVPDDFRALLEYLCLQSRYLFDELTIKSDADLSLFSAVTCSQ